MYLWMSTAQSPLLGDEQGREPTGVQIKAYGQWWHSWREAAKQVVTVRGECNGDYAKRHRLATELQERISEKERVKSFMVEAEISFLQDEVPMVCERISCARQEDSDYEESNYALLLAEECEMVNILGCQGELRLPVGKLSNKEFRHRTIQIY